jgi:phage baseplate assembly protein W
MSTPEARYGTDLRLLDDLERQNSRAPGNDLRTVGRGDRFLPDGTEPRDLAALAGVENLAQALLLRLLTWRGELAPLGHPDYGSRLHELVGQLNTDSTRNRAKLYVLQALADEPRIRRVVSATVTPSRAVREEIDIDLRLEAVGDDAPELRLVLPFSLAGGAAP